MPRREDSSRASRIGVLGAGQLGQMLGEAGKGMGLELLFLDPAESPPARTAGSVIQAPFDDDAALERLGRRCDVVTYEFENVPVAAVQRLAALTRVAPPASALEHAQDRLREKTLFGELGIPVPAWRPVSTREELDGAVAALGLPLVLKTRRFGYDGKGQAVIRREADIGKAWRAVEGEPSIAEQWLRFEREVSVIGARRPGGQTVIYPLTENLHRDGILRTSKAPVEDPAIVEGAGDYLHRLLARLDYAGVLALELFVAGGRLLANEFAPRVHNSGHWTIEGAQTSQFENHLRAILDLPLGDTACTGHAGMVNVIGRMPEDRSALAGSGWLHDYGKEPRAGRKLAHVTFVAEDAAERDRKVAAALAQLDRARPGRPTRSP